VKPRLLQWLCCPACEGPLSLTVTHERSEPNAAPAPRHRFWSASTVARRHAVWDESWSREVIAGRLSCTCGAQYPIHGGVPRMLHDWTRRGDEKSMLKVTAAAGNGFGSRRTRECYAYLWRFKAERIGWQHKADDERNLFLRNMSVAPEELPGRTLLDAGCGDGRFTASLAELGLETIGIDLSEGVEVGYAHNRDPLVHYVQGDLLNPPFRASSFDHVWSFGVLHHTPDTRRAFSECAKLLCPGGRMFVWLYDGAPKGRSAVIRLSQRAPLPVKRLVSHALQFGNGFKRRLGIGNPVTAGQTADEVYFWNLDMYGPEHRHLQSQADVQGWFNELGFHNITLRERMKFGFGMTGDLPPRLSSPAISVLLS
jgi:SAM-dependent methyltransferase/uncharacterized protein YbaR (Trm112 family)